jgi:hypothetical protein
MEPWQQYLETMQQAAQRIPPHAFGRGDLLAEIAHDAYQHTSDRLTAEGWDPEKALTVMRLLNQVAGAWIGRDGEDWDGLRREMQTQYEGWTRPAEG